MTKIDLYTHKYSYLKLMATFKSNN
jgi:hypothetical protein